MRGRVISGLRSGTYSELKRSSNSKNSNETSLMKTALNISAVV